MKKSLLIAALAAIALSIPAWGQVINVTAPAAGADWCIGNGYTITWTKSGTMPDTVKIRLRRAGAPESETSPWSISDGTPNDGSFGTTPVPASIPAGDYFIRVRTNSPDVIGDSAIFQIVNCVPEIDVTKPNGTNWYFNSTYAVNWTKSGTMPDTVKIRLRRAGAPESEAAVWSISDGTANDGSFATPPVPNTIPEGSYFVRVKTNSPDVTGNSVNFEIKEAIINPDLLNKLKRHRKWEIKWPPDPDPCLCPEFDIRDMLEFFHNNPRIRGSFVLLKNGEKFQVLGSFGRGKTLPNALKAKLNRQDFNLMKNGGAKFSIAILDEQGKILNESALQGAQQEQIR